MIAGENNELNQNDNSSTSSENEFKELDNEIEKVVRGEAPFEDGMNDNNCGDMNNHKSSQNSNKNDPKIINNMNKNIININNKLNKTNFSNQSNYPMKNFNSMNIKEKSYLYNMINSEAKFPIINNAFPNTTNECKANYFEKKNVMNNTNKNNLSLNLNPKNIVYNSFSYNIINNNLNEFMALNNNISNNGINYIKKLNEIGLLNNMVNCINNDLNISKQNVNNNQLFSNFGNYFNTSNNQSNNLSNNMLNNMVINNQMINPININVQFGNNQCNIDMDRNSSSYCRNILNNNDFNNNINNYISHYLQMNNIKKGNPNINNIIKDNNEIFINNLENRLNNIVIDSIINNIINNNQVLNNVNTINNNSYLNNFNFENINNNNKQFNNFKMEKKSKNTNKRKIFNPLPESEKEKNIINLMDIFQCKDLRTTLMIKNIPNKYTLISFLDEINEYFKNTYDIFYLPIDYINKCNLGFAFINFVEPFHIILFYELYRGKKWKKFNSDKICELLFAKFQGRKELISHFERGKVLSFESEDKRPLILPEPTVLPKINLPFYYLDIFHKLYPSISYKIKNINNKNNSALKVFSINGNFHKKLNM